MHFRVENMVVVFTTLPPVVFCPMSKNRFNAFTLAELLIALAILGVIATFTIPKILLAGQNSESNAKVKEAASMIAAAYDLYKMQNATSAVTGIEDLTPYLNYVAMDTASNIDDSYTQGSRACSMDSGVCLRLHSGAYLQYWPADNFNGVANTNGVPFTIDPDGKVTDGTTNGPGKSIHFFLYYNGRVLDHGNIVPGTNYNNGVTWDPNPAQVPPYFSW